jgi:HAD superfamily hydrolase (TIGR01490 family)
MVRYFYQKKKISLFFYLKIYFWFLLYKLRIVSKGTSLMEKGYRLLKGIRIEELKNFLYDFFYQELKPRIFPQALERISFHKNQGHEIILVSKSCKILIDIIKEYLNLNLAIATELEIKDEIFTGKINGEIMYGKKKAEKAKELAEKNNWNLKESYAYTDHYSDLPLLEIVGHPCVVNPDKKLEKEAKKHNWPIFYWKI